MAYLGQIIRCDSSFQSHLQRGRVVGGKPEWNVVVTNNCKCDRRSIILNCKGFQSAELAVPGSTLAPGASVKFSYAWDPSFIMFPKSADIVGAC
ncbi:unnamed protein product [Malus baccata var. baccata]